MRQPALAGENNSTWPCHRRLGGDRSNEKRAKCRVKGQAVARSRLPVGCFCSDTSISHLSHCVQGRKEKKNEEDFVRNLEQEEMAGKRPSHTLGLI